MRTGSEMLQRTKEILHDTGRGFATDNPMYDPEALLRRLNDGKRRLAKALMQRPGQYPVGGPAYVTLNRISKTCVATEGTNVPDDFWYLQAGIKSDSTYVPRAPMSIGEALLPAGHDLIYVRAGVFHGPSAVAFYWAYPKETIEDDDVTLTEFCDGFYDAVELLAARESLPEEQSDSAERWKLFTTLFMEAIQSFQ